MLEHEVERIYERYAIEVVERFGLCPWAASARRSGQVRIRVIAGEITPDLADPLAALAELARDEIVTVGLLVYPVSELGRQDFERFVGRLAGADAERWPRGETPFAMAAFHPHAAPSLEDPERLVPFLRRTPDPTVQLVRHRALDEVRRGDPPESAALDLRMLLPARGPANGSVRQRVLEHDLRTVSEVGIETIEAVFEDIRQDRERSYARIGLAPAPR